MKASCLISRVCQSCQSSIPLLETWSTIRWKVGASYTASLPVSVQDPSAGGAIGPNLGLVDLTHSAGGGNPLNKVFTEVWTTSCPSEMATEAVTCARRGRVEAVFFDMDDTLVLTHEADRAAHRAVEIVAAGKMPHLNTNAMIEVFMEGFAAQAWDPSHYVEVTEWRARIWGRALAAQGVHDMEFARELQNCFDTERMLAFQWAAGVELIVEALIAEGIKVGIITNGHFKVQRKKLEACKASSLFSTILVGGEEPNQKPHVDIFHKACKLAGCTPEGTVMVGDNLETDILGGRNAGFLATVWVNLHNLQGIPAGTKEPHYVISSIAELPDALKLLGLDLKIERPSTRNRLEVDQADRT